MGGGWDPRKSRGLGLKTNPNGAKKKKGGGGCS